MKKPAVLLLGSLFFVLPLTGCYTLNHTVGSGAPADAPVVASERQWYVLWGLVPLNNVDGGQLAKSKGLTTNYTIQSQQSFLDVILNVITGIVTISGQTVSVMASPGGGTAPAASAPPAGNSLALGNQALANKDYNGALQYYQAAASADPNSAAAYQGEGTCYYYMGQKAQAVQAYEKALQLNPGNTQLQNFINSLK